MVNKNNDMGMFLNCRPSAGYQMTTITFRRKFMHFKSFYVLIILRYKLHFLFGLICMSAGAKAVK